MSFSLEVKRELAQIELTHAQAKAQLGALLVNNGVLLIVDKQFHLKASFTQTLVAKRYVELVKQVYGVECELTQTQRQNRVKSVDVTLKQEARSILEDLGIFTPLGLNDTISRLLILEEPEIRAYLAGWFLVGGSINSPKTSKYHCEIRVKEESVASQLMDLFSKYYVPFKLSHRRHELFIYVKSSDKIADVLRLIGAHQALMDFEGVRIQRDFHNSLTRLDNCELANEVRTIQAGERQVKAILLLKEMHRLDDLDTRLKEIAYLRLDHPDLSLNELASQYSSQTGSVMSKSGMKHRLDKLMLLAQKLQEKEE